MFNPELLQRMFLSLTYFRVWVIYALFPLVVLLPDLIVNYISCIFFPSPMDFIIYNEVNILKSFKEKETNTITDVINPFKDNKNYIQNHEKINENVDNKKLNLNKKEQEENKDISKIGGITGDLKKSDESLENLKDQINDNDNKSQLSDIKNVKIETKLNNLIPSKLNEKTYKKANLNKYKNIKLQEIKKKDSVFADFDFQIKDEKKPTTSNK